MNTRTHYQPVVSTQSEGQAMRMIRFLQEIPLFQGLSSQQLQSLSQDVQSRRFSRGDIIFREGDPSQLLYLVQSGQVRIYVNGLNGSETSVILLGRPGDMFGELAVIDGLPRSATAVALDTTTLYTINRENFRQRMLHNPQLALNFMKELTYRVRYNTRQMDSLATLPISQRLARKLLELAQDYGRIEANSVIIDMTMNQTNLASLIGATRESTNKFLSDFRERGLIWFEYGRITILDADALRAEVTS
ncbi:cAMP-binding proteins - catabolite gene activator and regulatory subunit of cAMP-dependent protein kinases [hydrothermal vent metagenome]|uniref:cAMP-binding proteins - catabolite gene activator and regulatory subunit of cAMP-dependent protein kinases n=1 Tax=hydrothermal vent metagenome TaxID=652676 RepID=A0A3B0UV48_9ZZZZ